MPNDDPDDHYSFRRLSRAEAEHRVREFERTLSRLLRSVSPGELIPAAAKRVRAATLDKSLFPVYPPHSVVRVIEACCAYWRPWHYESLTEGRLREAISTVTAFDDPSLTNTLAPESDLFEFMLYMHRTQMDMQGGVWWMPIGRFVRLFGEPSVTPVCNDRFQRTYGLTLRQWFQMAFAVHAGTVGLKAKFAHAYAQQFPGIGLPGAVVQQFLDEVSQTPEEIGRSYLLIREGDQHATAAPTLTWLQRRPRIADKPLIRLPLGYVAPIEAYIADLFGDSLFRRIVTVAPDEAQGETPAEVHEKVRAEVGRAYQRYVESLLRHHLPGSRIWQERDLLVESEHACDFAVELPECLLLIECKAVVFDRDVVTRNAVLNSPAVTRLVEGYKQVISTAERIAAGRHAALGIDTGKPRYAIVASLGEIPAANYSAVWTFAQDELRRQGASFEPVPSILADRPQAFHHLAIEHLVLCLKAKIATLPELFAERASQPPLAIGDWQVELSRKCRERGKQDISFWDAPARNLLDELGAKPPSAKF